MFRTILTILLFLLLGLVTSIAVAWAAAVGYQAADAEYTREFLLFGQLERAGRDYAATAVTPPDGGGIRWWSGDDRWGPFPWWSALDTAPAGEGAQISEFAAGWPMLCVRSVILKDHSYDHPFAWKRTGRIEGRLSLPWPEWDWDEVDHLPMRPIWPNLLVNIAFWTVFWMAVASLRNLWRFNRSLRRVPKGLCGWCGYDLRKTPPDGKCPECGHGVTSPPRLLTMPSWVGALVLMLVMGLFFGATVSAFALAVEQWPLHRAAYDGAVATLDAQLAGGADIDGVAQIRGARDATPLVLAIRGGQVETTERLIDAGADVNVVCNEGLPLVIAVEQGDRELVRMLLDAGADPDRMTSIGQFALATAAMHDEIDIAQLLLAAGADPSINVAGTAFFRARSTEMIDLLLEHGAAIGPSGGTFSPIANHIQGRRMDLARHLIDRGAPVDFSALRAALHPRRLRTLQYLVEHGGDLSATDGNGSSIWHSVDPREPNPELWEFVYEHNPNVNSLTSPRFGSQTALHNAFDGYGGSISTEFVEFMLDHGADPRIRDINGRTAIDDAYPESIRQMLIEAAEKLEREDAADGKASDVRDQR